ncbi:hypothetical protein N7481_004668 [Penicillium waksmanii]|uniref:uncharacterized protein n=1 Tax=Penicillium waksmanii TaxID=69791 RepID=UPI002547BF20|nr:uncharacterized protein N7481_004668 [Penicillium waksmanii]KAJ5989458.1 hypothetical protein N7481_004668 [Penicillium waksmanii]
MMSQSLRASRSLFTRVSRQQVPVARTFLTSAVRRGPLPSRAEGLQAHPHQGRRRRCPRPEVRSPPGSRFPEEANLAGELSAYESQEVEVEGQAAAGEAAPVEESWFEEEEETPAAAH